MVTMEPGIIGGVDAELGEFQFYVLWSGEGGLCSRSRIHEDIVLTAAHCTLNGNIGDYVRIGSYSALGTNEEVR
jgi:hypothetical protein